MASMTSLNLELPWSSSIDDDKRYNRILVVSIALMLVLSILVTVINVPDIPRAEKEKLPPQLARVMLEKQKLPPPKPVEPPKVKEKKPEEKKPEPEKEKPKPKPVVKPKPKVQPPQADIDKARAKAQNSGVMQFKDDLAEMRDMLQTEDVQSANVSVTNNTAKAAEVDRAMITGAAKTASGGINTAALSRDTGGTALSGRKTTKVTSNLGEASAQAGKATASNSNGSGKAARSEEEIRKIMEQHKGAIYSIYNRALRKNAALQGKMVVKIVIDPNGRIVAATLVSSELGDKELEDKILNRIRLISFPASNVLRTTINQTFDFLPQ